VPAGGGEVSGGKRETANRRAQVLSPRGSRGRICWVAQPANKYASWGPRGHLYITLKDLFSLYPYQQNLSSFLLEKVLALAYP